MQAEFLSFENKIVAILFIHKPFAVYCWTKATSEKNQLSRSASFFMSSVLCCRKPYTTFTELLFPLYQPSFRLKTWPSNPQPLPPILFNGGSFVFFLFYWMYLPRWHIDSVCDRCYLGLGFNSQIGPNVWFWNWCFLCIFCAFTKKIIYVFISVA